MTETTHRGQSEIGTDAELLNLFCHDRDESAFAELVRRHSSMVLSVCYQSLRHHQDAQDAFQATFFVLATRAKAIKKESSLASWLYKVAYRTAMRAAKKRPHIHCVPLTEDVPTSEDPLATIHLQSLQLAMYEELSQLPASYQGPIILCYLEGKSRKQAAGELNCSDASIKAKLTRGKQLLRARLSRRGIALSVAFAVCNASTAAASQFNLPELITMTVDGCLANQCSTSIPFSSSVTNLVAEGSTMTSIPTTTKYFALACLSSIAFLGFAWTTTVSTAQDSDPPNVIQLRAAEAAPYSARITPRSSHMDANSVRLVNDTQDFSIYMGVQDDQESRELKEKIRYAEKKAAAYLMLRDAELQRANSADDAPSKLEAKARAQLHEAEADKLAGEIRTLKSKMRTDDNVFWRFGLGNPSGSRDPVPCCRNNNLAYGRTVTASSQEESINNLAQLAVDGDLSTRWCANDDLSGEWIQVDLGTPKDVSKIRIHWEMMESEYSYKIETSTDGKAWQTSIDTSEDPKAEHMPEHALDAKETRFIRITFLGNGDGFWGSIREIEVTDGELSERPDEAWEKIRDDASGWEIIDLSMLIDA